MKETYTLVGFISQATSRSVSFGCCLSGRWFVCSQGSGTVSNPCTILSKGYGWYCRSAMEMQPQAQGMELFHDFVLLRQCWSHCILAWWLQIWISKVPEVSMGSKGETAVPPKQLFIRILVPAVVGDTFNSLVERDILILRGTANLMESKWNSHMQLAPCAALPLPAPAVQAELPGRLLKLLFFRCL